MKITLPAGFKNYYQQKGHFLLVGGLIAFVTLGLVAEVYQSHSAHNSEPTPAQEAPDTIIPKGYVLVPIELQNSESLSALISEFAIVDLYLPQDSSTKSKGKKIGRHLRLLRAPLNPNTFAVLVPDAEVPAVVNHSGPMIAVIQNRSQSGNGAIEREKKSISHVNYYLGG